MDDPSSSTKSEAVAYHFSGAKRSRQELPPGNRLASPVAFTLGACVASSCAREELLAAFLALHTEHCTHNT